MELWRDLFSPRQLLCHGTSVEVFREMLDADRADGELEREFGRRHTGIWRCRWTSCVNYNSRMSRLACRPGRSIVKYVQSP